MNPEDQAARDRFTVEIDRNFSVVASAGSGKTRAITDRIAAIAKGPRAEETLPALVVVTFTNRAADEMQQRARQRILEAGVGSAVMAAFNRAFFGTIHSFCVMLLRAHGHLLGLRGEFESSRRDDDALWMEFVQQHAVLGATLAPEHRATLHRLVEARRLMELGRAEGAARIGTAEIGGFPEGEFDAVLASSENEKATRRTIGAAQDRLRTWIAAWKGGDTFAPLPEAAQGGKEFLALWAAAMAPLRAWARMASLTVAAEVERAFRRFRLERGVLTFDDQVSLARELFDHPEAARRIREKQHRVILDEAQDTDPAQFSVLLETARLPSATGAWPEEGEPPRAGRFCMVGDFQQSIYGGRADLAVYRGLHEALVAAGGEALTFSVTFRLDEKPLAFVNACFPGILTGTGGQASFVPLNERPDVLPGQAVRLELDGVLDLTDWTDERKARHEAACVAAWLREQGLQKLRAPAWSGVAILCPRKAWFSPLRDALRAAGLDAQVQSERDIAGDSPAFAWFTALMTIMAAPRDGYEIAGVLREILGISDHDLAVFAEGHGERFELSAKCFAAGPAGGALRLLAGTFRAVGTLPLYAAAVEIVRATQLRERLLALPAEECDGLETELDHLLTRAAQAEAAGQSLAEFARQMREDFFAPRAVRAPRPEAVQLITCQKAKGSEWPAVIVPFFSRRIRGAQKPYPRLVRSAGSGGMQPALCGEDIDAELKAMLDRQDRQEMERLLYVALTRAKHTLVIVNDEALFRGKPGVSPASQTHVFQAAAAQPNHRAFMNLPPDAAADRGTLDRQTERAAAAAVADRGAFFPPWPRGTLADARSRAAVFVKRNPSALAEAEYAEAPRESAPPPPMAALHSPGALYGDWWHGMIEHLDWSADPAAWEVTFSRHLARSPDPARSQREWQMFCNAIQDGGDIAAWLANGAGRCHAELPFLWRMSGAECMEGTIDLAVRRIEDGAWLILDWKTNSVAAKDADKLREHYEPQLAAYWKAAGEMLKAPVRAALYSTATGRWLRFEDAKLEARWKELSARPDRLAAVLAGDFDAPLPSARPLFP